jgi:hypothetical protein
VVNTPPEFANVVPAPAGEVEPHAELLTQPPDGQLLYKVMKVEHLLASISASYLHFNRVDSYPDLPGYDPHDGFQLPADRGANAGLRFERNPHFTAANYYDQSRARTYACSFALECTEHLWATYANGSEHGKIGVVFDFQKLRARLNANWAPGNAQLLAGDVPIKQIFSINYGVVDYVDWQQHRANKQYLANPIEYTYLKARAFADEHELRVSLSALGLGRYAVGPVVMEFPETIQMHFDFKAALADGGIKEFIVGPNCNIAYLEEELARFNVGTATKSAQVNRESVASQHHIAATGISPAQVHHSARCAADQEKGGARHVKSTR